MNKIDIQNLMEDLEKYRIKRGITKTEMSVLMGCNYPQQYITWTQRNSLPKPFIPKALSLLQLPAESTDLSLEIYQKIAQMGPDQQQAVLEIVKQLLKKD